VWGAVALDRSLLKPEVSEQEFNAFLRAISPSVGFYVIVIVLAIFAPQVAAFGYLVIAIFAVLRVRGDRSPTSTADPA